MFKSKANTASNTVANISKGSDTGASFIGVGCTFTGNLDCQSSLRVEGTLIGNITGTGDIEVSATGVIEGTTISTKNLTVHGRIKANIEAQGFLRLHKNAHVEGDIWAESLDIESGAHFVGYSHTGQKPMPAMQNAKTITLDNSPTHNADASDLGSLL